MIAAAFIKRRFRKGKEASKFIVISAIVLSTLASCEQESASPDLEVSRLSSSLAERWYGPDQVELGAEVFAENCASCHGSKAEGLVPDWKQRLANGTFPPPPLDGTAHAWHHPLSVLLSVIDEGGAALGGAMPSFSSVLNEQEKLAAIAYFQDFWSSETYGNWLQMGGTD